MMTESQRRLVNIIRTHGENAEYWPVVNDWVNDAGPAKALALRNINRTVDALIRSGQISIDEDGLFQTRRKGLTDMRAPLTPVNGLAANGLRIVCLTCQRATTYGKAVAEGWTYDPEGKPYEAYYCPDDSNPRDPYAYHSHRADGLDCNLQRLNEADYREGRRCTCDDCLHRYADCREYRKQLQVLRQNK